MKRTIFLGLGVLLASVALSQAADDPLGPAREGKLQCYGPAPQRKSCQALSGYRIGQDGGIENPAEVLVAAQPVTVMSVITPVTVRAGSICGIARAQDIDAASFSMNGRPASPEESDQLRTQIKTALAARLNKEVCTAYLPNGALLHAEVSVDGVAQPQLSADVAWVDPAEGYKVAP